jgi:putative pyruvate formate lyase activating enzyme
MAFMEPAYIASQKTGRLEKKVKAAFDALQNCRLCPRKCGADRLGDERGYCRTGRQAVVASYNPHFGEEAPLVGQHGSGTVFFANCNLLCLFCQNFEISHGGTGQPVSEEQLAAIMLALQQTGCHNINFVSPSHVVPQILSAVDIAARRGLHVPLVYNSGGYDRPSTLRLLDGVVDIYMPDFKFWSASVAAAACEAPDYPEVVRKAILAMHAQVGDLRLDPRGVALRGLLIRHLVLPGGAAGTRSVMRFIARKVSKSSYVNVMSQYRPCGRAGEIPGFERAASAEEYREALGAARDEGITRLDQPHLPFRFR